MISYKKALSKKVQGMIFFGFSCILLFFLSVPFACAVPGTTTTTTGADNATGSTANGGFVDYFFGCSAGEGALECVVNGAYDFSLGAIAVLGAFMLIVAGIMYMTSGGNPERIGKAKKFIFGVLAGVGLLVLGRAIVSIIDEFFTV